jgi:uncharacterized membrane protein
MNNKKGASFSTIISVIGAVLIALGFLILIAMNWHDIPDIFKVVILVGVTCFSYILGIILKEYDYPGISKSMFLLGA